MRKKYGNLRRLLIRKIDDSCITHIMYQHTQYHSFEGQFVMPRSAEDRSERSIREYPSLPDSFPFEEVDMTLVRKRHSMTKSEALVNPAIESFSWLSVFQELFVSRTIFQFNNQHSATMPEDMTICWSPSEHDSDVSTVLECDDDWGNLSDHDPSEEDIFCVETILRKVPTADDEDEYEETVLVTISTSE